VTSELGYKTICRGCQIFLGTTYQNGEKYTKLLYNIPNGHKKYQKALIIHNGFKINQHFPRPFQGLPKYSKMAFLQLYYLATLIKAKE
jgi:hypothetical protein